MQLPCFQVEIPQLPVYNKSFLLKSSQDGNANDTDLGKKAVKDNDAPNITNKQIDAATMNNVSNINKDHLILNIENRHTPDMKQVGKEAVQRPNNVNENKIDKSFQFKDIVNVVPLDKKTSKSHSKYDKHRQLNIKDVNRKGRTSQIASKNKSENSKMKLSTSDSKIKTDETKNLSKNNMNNENIDSKTHELKYLVDETESEKENKKDSQNEKSLSLEHEAGDKHHVDVIFHSLDENLNSQSTQDNDALKKHSLTRILSPTKEIKTEERGNAVGNIEKQELKISDLVIPMKGVHSLERELEIQRNKVHQLKG